MRVKSGDRVAIYNGKGRRTGTVGHRYADGTATIRTDEDDLVSAYHEKQCRRLVKRERRRVWIHKNAVSVEYPAASAGWVVYTSLEECRGDNPHSPEDHWIEFLEVRKRK